MKALTLLIVIFAMLSPCTHARIGETLVQTQARYGQGKPSPESEAIKKIHPAVESLLRFEKNGTTIDVGFLNGKSAFEKYQTPWEQGKDVQHFAIMELYAPRVDWTSLENAHAEASGLHLFELRSDDNWKNLHYGMMVGEGDLCCQALIDADDIMGVAARKKEAATALSDF